MSRLAATLLAAGALPTALVAVGLVRRYTLRRGVLDVPTARSSHVVPTPRGGGLGVVIAVLVAGGGALVAAGVAVVAVVALGAVLGAVATIGWIDDHRSASVRARLAVHLLAGLAVAALAHVAYPAHGLVWQVAAAAWWLFWTVSSINVVNFMDGIDGLIGSQLVVYGAYVAALGGGWATAWAPAWAPAWLLGVAVAGASAGFLAWNWAPARIFLGDVGSGPLGLLAVLLGLALLAGGRTAFVHAYLPLYPLFLDAAVTLVRRARRGERLTEPHRSHLYQRLANGGWGHARTAVAFAVAALGGAALGLAQRDGLRPLPALAYALGVLLVGWRLDARVPWAPAARAPAVPDEGAEDAGRTARPAVTPR